MTTRRSADGCLVVLQTGYVDGRPADWEGRHTPRCVPALAPTPTAGWQPGSRRSRCGIIKDCGLILHKRLLCYYKGMALVIEGQEFYTTGEACAALGVKPATLYTYVSRGLVHSYRQGIKRQRLYRRSEVDALRTFGPGRRDGPLPDLPTAESWIPYT